jgi:phospholipase C
LGVELLLLQPTVAAAAIQRFRKTGLMTHFKQVSLVCLLAVLSLSLLTGCAGVGLTGSPSPTPTPGGSIQSVNHIIFMMQENRSFDAYFGKINDFRAGVGLGRDTDDLENNFTLVADDGSSVSNFHLVTSCIFNTSAAWTESHGDVDKFGVGDSDPVLLNGFLHTAGAQAVGDVVADTKGIRAMGFYNQGDLPSPYFLATQFATSDRFYAPAPVQTEDERLYSMAATSQGLVHPPQDTNSVLTSTTIFQLLDNAGVSWKIYSVDKQPNGQLITTLRTFQPYSLTKEDHIVPIAQFFNDLLNNTLPQFSYIEPGFTSGQDEHPGPTDNIQTGTAFMASIFNALINSPVWKDSVFFQTFDEGGGLFDHVSPMIDGRPILELSVGATGQVVGPGLYPTDAAIMHVPNPDGIAPRDLLPADRPGNFTRTGFRVPLIIVSPFAKVHYVSHTPMDYTAILKFVEERFNLPTLNARDAVQPPMDEFFDFANSPNLSPGAPPSQPNNIPCNADLASAPSGPVAAPTPTPTPVP